MATKKIILSADDYGQNPEISAAILVLAKKKRLSAVSCMVNNRHWDKHMDDLKQTPVQIGLHLNFTHGAPLSNLWQESLGNQFPNLIYMLKLCYGFKVSEALFYAEIKAQIIAFQKAVGRLPDFIDGHQHAHQLPKIRDALIQVLHDMNCPSWVRVTYYQFSQCFTSIKAFALFFLGGGKLTKLLDNLGIRRNQSFAGDYNFKIHQDYRNIFLNALKKSASGGLIMCHPGLASQDKSDLIREARLKEYMYLSSPYFIADLKALDVQLF